MAKIHSLSIKNFRGLENFSHTFNDANLFCLIGRGDSGKSTILEAIYSALSPQWNLTFHDGDFYNGNHEKPIEIEITLLKIPTELLNENKFGLYVRGFNSKTNTVHDEIEDNHEQALTIRLEVGSDLESHWFVTNERQHEPKPISASERAKFNVCYVSDFIDRHFSWNKGNPLYTLLTQHKIEGAENSGVVLKALRDAKKRIDEHGFEEFDQAIAAVKEKTASFGLDITNTSTSIDFKDILSKDGRFSLHDQNIPFRLKGKGSKRLISIAIQIALCKSGGIILIDEVEQSLEPDRAQHTANILAKQKDSQIFLTTHSRDVLVELESNNLLLLRKAAIQPTIFISSLQGCLRSNPEAFFAEKILVCEGATEIGICRALNTFRIKNGRSNFASKGIRTANGEGNSLVEYVKGFAIANYDVCLFCDSDESIVHKRKNELRELGINIIDWDEGQSLEEVLAINLPLEVMRKMLVLAGSIKQEETGELIADVYAGIKQSISEKLGQDCPEKFTPESDSLELRKAIGLAANKGGWFKRQNKGELLGDLIFEHYDQLENTVLKQRLEALSIWSDGN